MCYSAQIKAAYQKLMREFGAVMSLADFAELYVYDAGKAKPKTPKALDDAFAQGDSLAEAEIWESIRHWNGDAAAKAEKELFTQSTRLNTAQRALETKVTKKAQEDVRIATNKIAAAKAKLEDLRRTDPLPRDARIFPGMYAPVTRRTSRRCTRYSTTSVTRTTSTGWQRDQLNTTRRAGHQNRVLPDRGRPAGVGECLRRERQDVRHVLARLRGRGCRVQAVHAAPRLA